MLSGQRLLYNYMRIGGFNQDIPDEFLSAVHKLVDQMPHRLAEYDHLLAEKRAKVKALVAEGKSLDDIKQSFGVKDAPAQAGRPRFPSLIEIIYLELTEKK